MEIQFCHSCAKPLMGEEGKDYRGNYCGFCSDENGDLYPRELVQKGLAEWLKQWAPQGGPDFMERADNYLKAMPAWVEE